MRRILLPRVTTFFVGVLSVNVMPSVAEESDMLLPELIITANKKEQTLSTAPVHASVYDADQLKEEGVDGLSQLEGLFAGLSFQPFGQSGINSPVLRGLTANFNALSNSTLLMVDGVPTLTAQGYENNLLDIDRIEILRGPQSTVYGRNAEVGVISIFSNDLEGEDKSRLGLEVGSRNKKVVQLSTSQTLLENKLYASLSASFLEQDGFISNTTTGGYADDKEHKSLNAGLRWLVSDATDVVVRYSMQSFDDGAALWGSSTSSARAEVASGTDSFNDSLGQTFSINATHKSASGIKFNSVTAYNDYVDDIQQDTDFTSSDISYIARDNHLRTLSQELRLEGMLGDTEWLVGAYLEGQNHDLSTTSSSTYYGTSTLMAEQTGYSSALFTNWTTPLGAETQLITGLRASRDEVSLSPTGYDEKNATWTNLTPQLTLQHNINPDHMIYVTYSEGVRSGGFNTLSASVDFLAFDPEESQNFEMGVKGAFINHQLRYSLSAYHMDIEEMQVVQMPSVGLVYITNAAEATSDGVEASVAYYFDESWSLETGLSFNKTEFGTFIDGTSDYSGNKNLFSPEFNGHLTLRYDGVNDLSAAISVVANGSMYLNAANTYEQDAYEVVNVSSSYSVTDNAKVSAYVNNVTDQEYDAIGYQNGYVTVYSPPREFGMKFVLDL
ncbi:TonB-dependent receptor [Marinomonas sp.]|nr:TonB-dependent receptor [Marinomonas sp.]MDB4836993.1 TonB-dependent receptor [Marinomonas sp.]